MSDGTRTYTWEHGRELSSLRENNLTWSYTYDSNGLRTSRGSREKSYRYVYSGSKLVQMTVDGYTFNFTYDASGTPQTISLNGYTYYYVTNIQGDVVGILNEDGVEVVRYGYDAWGNVEILCDDDPISAHNPLLYRGYIYDFETGLYYLQSRYYDPALGRFINADAFASTGQGLLGNNMFAYCLNNPINLVDWTGSVAIWYYLMLYSDWGYVHRMVQNHIKKQNPGMRTEVTLDTYGRADIMDEHGAVWEIKHAGKDPGARATEAFAQAFSYVLINKDATSLGSPLKFSGHFYIRCEGNSYLVEYNTPMPGVVLYTVTPVDNYNGVYDYIYVPNENTAKKRQKFERQLSTGLTIGGVVFLGGPVFNNPRANVDPRGDLAII